MTIELDDEYDGEETFTKIQKKGRRRNEGSPRQKIKKRHRAPQQEESMKKKSQTQTQTQPQSITTDTAAPKPFWEIMKAARAINTRRPAEEQPEELTALKEALAGLDGAGRDRVLWRIVTEVLEEKAPVQCLFPVAYAARKIPVAHNAAVLKRAITEGSLDLGNLRLCGLADVRKNADGRPYIVYRVGTLAFSNAIPKLRVNGKAEAADILATHLRKVERYRQLAKAARDEEEVGVASSPQ